MMFANFMTNPTQQLTEAEAVEIVAKKDGWMKVDHLIWNNDTMKLDPPKQYMDGCGHLPCYMDSRDALQPVLETMTAEERGKLMELLCKPPLLIVDPEVQPILAHEMFPLVELPARTLCLAVAAAIKEVGK